MVGEKKALRIEVIYHFVLFFFFFMLFAISTSWNLNGRLRNVERPLRRTLQIKKDQKQRWKESMSLQMLKRAHGTMRGECRLRETTRASCSGCQTIACLPAWVTANSKASVSCLTPPSSPFTQLPVYDHSQQFTAAKIHFLPPNPIAHYPVHCIRALIFPFSCAEEERSASVINPLYSNK